MFSRHPSQLFRVSSAAPQDSRRRHPVACRHGVTGTLRPSRTRGYEPPRQRHPLAAQRHARRRDRHAARRRRAGSDGGARRSRRPVRRRSPAAGTRWAASSSARPACSSTRARSTACSRFDAERGSITVEGGIQWPALLDHLERRVAGRGREARPVGHHPEADRRRPPEPRRRAGLQRARARPDAQADRRAGRVVRPARPDRRRPHLLAHARTRSCSGWRSAATASSASSRACSSGCGRASRSSAWSTLGETERHHGALRAADPRRLPLRRLPVRDRRRRATAFCAAASSPATSRCRADTPLTEHPTRFNPEDWARLTRYSHTNKRRAFEVYSSRYLRRPGRSTGPTRSSRPPTSTTTTPTSIARWARSVKGIGDDHRDLRRSGRGWPRSWKTRARRCGAHGANVDLRHRAPDRERRRDVSGVGARALRVRHLQPARRPHAVRASSAPPTRSAR